MKVDLSLQMEGTAHHGKECASEVRKQRQMLALSYLTFFILTSPGRQPME